MRLFIYLQFYLNRDYVLLGFSFQANCFFVPKYQIILAFWLWVLKIIKHFFPPIFVSKNSLQVDLNGCLKFTFQTYFLPTSHNSTNKLTIYNGAQYAYLWFHIYFWGVPSYMNLLPPNFVEPEKTHVFHQTK